MSSLSLDICRLPHAKDIPLPAYASDGAAGLDLCAANDTPIRLESGDRVLVPTGFAIKLPALHEAQIRPRSGLAAKHGVTVANAPGTIDSDYRGEIKIILINLGSDAFIIERGMRIAQMVIAPVIQSQLREVDSLDTTSRGADGFGSTGT
ncbi:dUTP diphosphatase [Candidatus Puniceispirillum sp.]|jgi:dUTP pyrophosphatase|uniref:dUTP diphosphatase n=1 Tax=Candidatus Puniceispirillum sp. TaxID=2026719 RepID=UPI002FCDE674